MKRRVYSMLTVVTILALLAPAISLAGLFSGTVKSVSSSRISVQGKSSKLTKSFRLPSSVKVSLDGKSSNSRRLKPGQQVTIYTSASGLVTRIRATTASSKPKTTLKPKPKVEPKPEPKPSTPPPSRTSSNRTGRSSSTSEWSQFRGPNRDNISLERGLLKSWPENGPRLAWSAHGMGQGYSSVSVANGMIYTMGLKGGQEVVVATEADSGNIAWTRPHARSRGNLSAGDGPRSTPTIVDGQVYVLGGHGDLSCLNAQNGQIVWQKNILDDFQGGNITWGISESVLVDGDKVICTPGGQRATMVALNKDTGATIWTSRVPGGNHKASYASPIIAQVGGVKQYVTFTSAAVIGVRASDGEPLWGNNSSANGTANCSTPLFYQNSVFSATGYNTGGTLLSLRSSGSRTTAQQVYHTDDMKNHHGGMVIIDGYLYGSDDNILTCIELRSGRRAWQSRSVGKGSVTYADGNIYLRSEQGPVAMFAANPQRYEERGRFRQAERSGSSAWAHPVIANGRLLLRDQDVLLSYDIRAQ